jgi:hypothetical protein
MVLGGPQVQGEETRSAGKTLACRVVKAGLRVRGKKRRPESDEMQVERRGLHCKAWKLAKPTRTKPAKSDLRRAQGACTPTVVEAEGALVIPTLIRRTLRTTPLVPHRS